MNKTKIIELDIDISAMIKSASEVKKKIDELNKSQKELKKDGDTNSQQFIQNASDLKVLNKSYQGSISAIAKRTQAIADAEIKEKLMVLALKSEVSSIEEARNQNKLLNQLRNETNITTQEGKEQLELLNKKLDENNEFIKENSDAYAKQKINIGNYKDGIKDAFSELNIFNGGLTGFIQRSKDVGGVGKLVKGSLKGMAQGFLGLTKASLTFIATPIGALLALLVGAFALVKNAMNRSEDATNKLKKSFSIVTGVFNTVLKALEPLGEFLIDGIVVGFEAATKAADKAIGVISKGLKFLGFDSASKSVENWGNQIKEGVKTSRALADAEIKLQKVQRKAQLTQLEYQKDAEKLRQIRDNENLSTKERIKANEDLGVVLKNQLKDELKIAKLALETANLRIEAEGKTETALNGQADALTKIKEIEERITGQESEQLTNRVSLQKDAAQKAIEANNKIVEARKKAIDQAIKESKTLLNIYIAEQGVKAKTLKEDLDLAEKVKKKRLKILDAELKAKKITQSEYNLAVIELDNELASKRAELTIDNATRELDNFKSLHKSKLDANQFLTEELLNQETERLDLVAQKEKEYHEKRLNEGVINQQEYHDAIATVDEENRIAKEELEQERKQAKKEEEVAQFEIDSLENEEKFNNQFDIDVARLEAEKERDVKAAKGNKKLIEKIEKESAKKINQIQEAKEVAQRKQAADTFGNIAQLLGEHTAAGKASGIAQATINTYQGVTEVWKAPSVLPEPFNTITKVAATGVTLASGLATVKKISSVSIPKAEKGAVFNIGGNRHSSGGTKFYGEDGTAFEAEQGEKLVVLNRAASAMLPLLSDINQQYGGVSLLGGGRTYLNSGGAVLRGSGVVQQSQNNQGQGLDSNALKEAVYQGAKEGTSDANIILTDSAIDGISTKQGQLQEVVNGANLGG